MRTFSDRFIALRRSFARSSAGMEAFFIQGHTAGDGAGVVGGGEGGGVGAAGCGVGGEGTGGVGGGVGPLRRTELTASAEGWGSFGPDFK